MTIQAALDEAVKLLKSNDIISPRLDAELLLAFVLKKDRSFLLIHADDTVSKKRHSRFKELVQKRIKPMPVAYLTGSKEFYGLDFIVDERVIIPRPETEPIVQWAIKLIKDKNLKTVIDVGTGCGNIIISIKKKCPEIQAIGLEYSKEALEVANLNNHQHNTKVDFQNSDLLQSFAGKADLIVANLPYLDGDKKDVTADAAAEPEISLFAGSGGLLLYERLFEDAGTKLNLPGYIMFESDPWQQPELEKLLQKSFSKVEKLEVSYFCQAFKLN